MKIYFAGSILGGRNDKQLYLKIINYLKKYGVVLTEHIGDQKLTGLDEIDPSDEKIYERDLQWLRESDVIIAEVSTPSLGVGYEIATAEKLGKRILCLYRIREEKRLSAMISGNKNLLVKKYKADEELFKIIDGFFNNIV